MIKTIDGNILENTDIDAIAHQCNTQNTMGSGIAVVLREKWPGVYQADTDFHKKTPKNRILGTASIAHINDGENVKRVFNVYGQDSYGGGRQTNYEALYSGLMLVRSLATDGGVRNLGIPYYIGCGFGGGDWRIVSAIIDVVFEDARFDVTICRLRK